MNSPAVQQMMSNPETIRAMMRMNPQLNQLIEQRPEIGRLLDDPEILQQSMRMMANPSLMREMTRNQDRAIGQLNAIPGGMNALARAHEEIADPLFEAFQGGGNNASGEINTYAQDNEGAPNTEALPNPWGPPPSQSPAPTATPTPALGAMPMGTAAPTANPQQPNPLAAMMMQPPAPMGAQPGAAPGANPMQGMMQQMMNNPQMMQQSMQMMQQMFGNGGGGMGMGMPPATPTSPTSSPTPTPQATTPGTTPAITTPPVAPNPMANPNPFMQPGFQQPGFGGSQPNPFQQMMQQMMANPQMMNNMAFNPGMNAGGYGDFQPPVAPTSPTATGAPPMNDQMQRIRFASQLAQLSAMGFSNEAACLRALAQHNGRVDAAIDTLLSSGEGMS
jgi:ubiquilin